MQIREEADPNSTLYLTLFLGSGLELGSETVSVGANTIQVGTITITLTHVQTASLAPGVYYYDIVLTGLLGINKDYYASGPFEVIGTGSR